MATKPVVCPDCGTLVPYGRLACAECGALIASVAGSPVRPLTRVESVEDEPPMLTADAEPVEPPEAEVHLRPSRIVRRTLSRSLEAERLADALPLSAVPAPATSSGASAPGSEEALWSGDGEGAEASPGLSSPGVSGEEPTEGTSELVAEIAAAAAGSTTLGGEGGPSGEEPREEVEDADEPGVEGREVPGHATAGSSDLLGSATESPEETPPDAEATAQAGELPVASSTRGAMLEQSLAVAPVDVEAMPTAPPGTLEPAARELPEAASEQVEAIVPAAVAPEPVEPEVLAPVLATPEPPPTLAPVPATPEPPPTAAAGPQPAAVPEWQPAPLPALPPIPGSYLPPSEGMRGAADRWNAAPPSAGSRSAVTGPGSPLAGDGPGSIQSGGEGWVAMPATAQMGSGGEPVGSASAGPAPAAEPGEAGRASVEPPTDLAGWLLAIGAFVAVVAFVLPWSSSGIGIIGSSQVGNGYLDRWGLANPANIFLVLAAAVVLALILVPNRLPRWLAEGVLPIVLGGIDLGVWFTYVSSPFGDAIGILVLLAAGGLLVLGGVLALRPGRHVRGGRAV